MKHHGKRARRSKVKARKLAALGGASLGLICGAKADSIITFDGFASDNTPINSIADYGDNISASSADYTAKVGVDGKLGTPDITLDWDAAWDTYTAWDGRG